MRTILFVCVHNSGRSQMAEAYYNHYAQGRARALSAGTQPADAVNPTVVSVMLEDGLDISENRPKLLTDEILDGADRVVSMGCGVQGVCPASSVETEEWEIEDPKDKSAEEVRRIRDHIRGNVLEMLAKDGILSGGEKPSGHDFKS